MIEERSLLTLLVHLVQLVLARLALHREPRHIVFLFKLATYVNYGAVLMLALLRVSTQKEYKPNNENSFAFKKRIFCSGLLISTSGYVRA